MSLPGDLFKVWQILQWVAADHDKDGALPSLDDCAYTMRKDEEWLLPLVTQLVERELIDKVGDEYRMHDWDEWQVRKPSDEPDAVLARVRKHRGQPSPDVTPRNALQSVTDVVTPSNARNAVKTRLDETREEEIKKPPVSLRSTSPRGARIPAHWPSDALLPEMIAYGAEHGIGEKETLAHIREYHDWWSQATKNATSLDWVKRWRAKFSEDVRVGRVGPATGRGGGMSSNGHAKDFATQRDEERTRVATTWVPPELRG
jgi:hypothetical protein